MKSFRAEPANHFSLPRRIRRLGELAYNLWWTWKPDAQRLFRRIDLDLWERTYHNPVQFLRQIERAQLNAVAQDRNFLDFYDRIFRMFDQYMKADDTWFLREHADRKNRPIAYFSTEFGMHETLPIYAGGLGVLSGDHLKEASDLGLPLVAVGFLYTRGYFSQHITEDGWQEARFKRLRFDDMPVMPILDENDDPLTVSVELPGREVLARMWEIHVGRVPLYLLDTDVEGNNAEDRELTSRLYNSDLEARISQEIILGIGGVRALRNLGYNPSVWHMNEGHSAFMGLERSREMVAAGHSFEQAQESVRKSTIFTTHTPVPAGSDEFPLWLIDKYFSHLWPELGLDRDQFVDIARRKMSWGETFSMPLLAFRFSERRNGVSELHGQVARKMWNFLWPDKREEDVPISYVTNGIHTGTWLARRLDHLFRRYLGRDWMDHLDEPDLWDDVENIPDEELWVVRRHLKRKLVFYMRDRAREQWLRDGVHPVQVIASGVLLDPYALTIGFARRFATYKRASLILQDLDRLLDLVNRPNRPVQIIFAGKAHPNDNPGKMLIQEVYRTVKQAENGGRLVFLEDYDMNVARYLVQGVDVWLNTPRRPNEASGTSGQKAALNGVLNFSILDGWWREGYNGMNGWAIGDETDHEDPDVQDQMDIESLYDILENEIIPLYYDRSEGNLPREWIARSKESIRTLGPQFSMRRMIKDYAQQLYLPAMEE
ncbi:MAG: alpha-glucan family phosphorylase [Anaerolineales bacterium]|nr:alpha-glucan family phosphorylase [Chloroflexota bacterium]MBL6979810.1 alpha-glucan family phosphorylase [Anaerolineales bacterium]